jgi:hypothetical protein
LTHSSPRPKPDERTRRPQPSRTRLRRTQQSRATGDLTAVAAITTLSRATLYRNPNPRAVITEHRIRPEHARTLGGPASEIAHLRTALEAIAGKVRHQEERLRRLERRSTGKPIV